MNSEIITETIKDLKKDLEYEREAYQKIKNIQRLSKQPEKYNETLDLIEDNGEYIKSLIRGVINGRLPN